MNRSYASAATASSPVQSTPSPRAQAIGRSSPRALPSNVSSLWLTYRGGRPIVGPMVELVDGATDTAAARIVNEVWR